MANMILQMAHENARKVKKKDAFTDWGNAKSMRGMYTELILRTKKKGLNCIKQVEFRDIVSNLVDSELVIKIHIKNQIILIATKKFEKKSDKRTAVQYLKEEVMGIKE